MNVVLKSQEFANVSAAAQIKIELLKVKVKEAKQAWLAERIKNNPMVTGMLWWKTSRPMTEDEALVMDAFDSWLYRQQGEEHIHSIKILRNLVNVPLIDTVSEFVLTEYEYKLALN